MKATLARLLFWRRPDEVRQRFAETEAFGARDLARAAESVRDPWLRRQLMLHARDEVKHARLLEEGTAPAERPGLGATVISAGTEEPGLDLEAMGGELPFIAFVHVAEKRAVEEFRLHRAALGDKGQFFDEILADEKRHVAWTGHALDRFHTEGRGAELDTALRQLRMARLKGAWLSVARRLSWVSSSVILTAIYFLLLWPFRLLAGAWLGGWQRSRPADLKRSF